MSNIVTSSVIGELVRDKTFFDWWQSEMVAVPFWADQKLAVIFMGFEPEDDEHFIEDADKAMSAFLSLGLQDKNAISSLVHQNYKDYLEDVGDDDIEEKIRSIKNENEIWQFVHPTDIYVSRREKDNDIYVQIACECDWEAEHGLQLVFKQGRKITRISAQDGHMTEAEAYDKPDEQDELLSQF